VVALLVAVLELQTLVVEEVAERTHPAVLEGQALSSFATLALNEAQAAQ